jgi:hypothetical protein
MQAGPEFDDVACLSGLSPNAAGAPPGVDSSWWQQQQQQQRRLADITNNHVLSVRLKMCNLPLLKVLTVGIKAECPLGCRGGKACSW